METMIPGVHDFLFITLDTLRYDVAARALAEGRTPFLASLLPSGQWEMRHTPGSFTYAAHHAFFAGFLPTPVAPGMHPRRFATRFPGSVTTTPQTLTFDTPDIVSGFAGLGYHTICIGGVGFFNKQSPLGKVLPGLFTESHWQPGFSESSPNSTELQVDLAVERLRALPRTQRVFLFLNVSAAHQPTTLFAPGAERDTVETQREALAYVDQHLPRLFAALQARAPLFAIVCADHGTTFGEDGYTGHRLAHPAVWNVPYAEVFLPERR